MKVLECSSVTLSRDSWKNATEYFASTMRFELLILLNLYEGEGA